MSAHWLHLLSFDTVKNATRCFHLYYYLFFGFKKTFGKKNYKISGTDFYVKTDHGGEARRSRISLHKLEVACGKSQSLISNLFFHKLLVGLSYPISTKSAGDTMKFFFILGALWYIPIFVIIGECSSSVSQRQSNFLLSRFHFCEHHFSIIWNRIGGKRFLFTQICT